jgi:hypothetical protein
MLSVDMLSVVMLSVIILSVDMLSVDMLSVDMLSAVKLNAFSVSVVAPTKTTGATPKVRLKLIGYFVRFCVFAFLRFAICG